MNIYKKRRQQLLNQLDNKALAIVATNPQQIRSGDTYYPFRPHSDFYYLTGFNEPQALLVLSQQMSVIFLRRKNKRREVWEGKHLGVSQAPTTLGINKAYALGSLDKYLPKLMAGKKVYADKTTDSLITLLNGVEPQSLKPYLHELRLFKGSSEIALMQQAVDVTIAAHTLAMQHVKPGMFEFEVQALVDGFFKKHNTEHAYTPIVAGGKNACTLHYTDNNQRLNNGDLLLIDAGCEFGYYAADITRTFPVNGKFSQAQAQIYQLVVDAQLAAIACIKPGVAVNQPHKISSKIIKNGLIELGILTADTDLKQFFMHGTGHWLGLDVHDVGTYKHNNKHRVFQAGMVTTVEPGIYLAKDAKISPDYWHIGVRIEDDVLVTATGNTVLSGALVKEISHIEALMI